MRLRDALRSKADPALRHEQTDAQRRIPEVIGAYPEPSMFGVSPAYGLFARHVSGLVLRDIEITTEAPDARPKLVLTDVSSLKADPGFVP